MSNPEHDILQANQAEQAEPAAEMTGGMNPLMERLRNSQAMRWAAGVLASASVAIPGTSEAAPKHTSKLERHCASQILDTPEIDQAFMQFAGKRNQMVSIRLGMDAVDKACDSRYRRSVSVMPRLVKGKNRHVNLDGPLHGNKFWDPAYFYPNTPKSNRAGEAGITNSNSHNLKVRYWKPGQKADFKLRLQERDARTHKVLRTKITKHPLSVHRGRYNRGNNW